MRKIIITALISLVLLPAAAAGSPQPPDPELWVMAADGTGQRNFRPWHYGPASWASDSRRVAVSGLLVIDTATGEETKITEGYDPDWSPVADEIAFVDHGSPEASNNIFLIGADGQGRREITSTPAGDYLPTWSPDGQRLAFLVREEDGSMRLWVVRRDGAAQLQLSDTPAVHARPAWSPDGSEIAFLTPSGQVHIVDSAGGEQQVVATNAHINSPVWCPDGSLYYSGTDPEVQGVKVFRADPAGPIEVTQGLSEDCSPDGKLAFVNRGDIHVMYPGETGTPNLTTSSDRSDQNARWSPDGSQMSFTSIPDLPPPIEVERTLEVSLRKHLVIRGVFSDDDGTHQDCFGTMRAQRLGADGWRTLKKKELAEGMNSFRMNLRDRKGFYRIVVSPGHSTWGERVCSRTESNIVRHRH